MDNFGPISWSIKLRDTTRSSITFRVRKSAYSPSITQSVLKIRGIELKKFFKKSLKFLNVVHFHLLLVNL